MIKAPVTRLVTPVLIAFCLLAIKASLAAQPTDSDLRFTILHTNDLHAHDESYSDHGKMIGGFSKIAHIIRSIRKHEPNVLAVDAGDIFQGTPFFKYYHGAVEVEMLNKAGYDIYTIGNHEFDDGPKNLAAQLKNAHFDVINCNLDASAVPELQGEIKPSVIKTINGQKIAFIGAIVPNITEVSLTTGGVKAKATGENWMEPIKQEIAKVKSQGIDKIVLVTHCGVELDKQLAQLPEVDIIVGGHSHTRLDKAIVIPHADGSNCMVVQTGCFGRALGKIDVAFDSKGQLDMANTHYHLINITDRIYNDKDVTAYLEDKAQAFAKERNTVLGVATGDFDNYWRRMPWDSALGDLITDSLAEAGAKYGATISFANRGGIRGPIEAGPITEEKVEEILPFENYLVIATVKGSKLLKVLENSVAHVNDYAHSSGNNGVEGLGGLFFDVHGLKFAYDPSKTAGSRILYALAADKDGTYKTIDQNADYRVAVNSYSFSGGEGYDFKGATDVIDTKTRVSVFFKNYLLEHKKLAPAGPSRIVPVLSTVETVDTTGNGKQIVLEPVSAGAKVYVVEGNAQGAENLSGQVPVPLSKVKVLSMSTVKPNETTFRFTLPTTNKADGTKHLYSAVVVPRKTKQPAWITPPVAN